MGDVMKSLLALSFALGVMTLQPADARAFDAYACILGIDCIDVSHTPGSSTGPANADFQDFYGTQLGRDLSGDAFTWTSTVTPIGDWFGKADDFNAGIHATYLWHDGAIICCTLDEPYTIIDGNLLGEFVGYDPNGISNAGQPLFPAFFAFAGGPTALAPMEYELSDEAMAFLSPDGAFHPVDFVGIQDGYGILAHWDFGYFNLVPAEGPPLASDPEPAGALILLPALVLLGWRFRPR